MANRVERYELPIHTVVRDRGMNYLSIRSASIGLSTAPRSGGEHDDIIEWMDRSGIPRSI